MCVSAGCVYDDRIGGTWVAYAANGAIQYFNTEINISDEEKLRLTEFVAEANAAPEN